MINKKQILINCLKSNLRLKTILKNDNPNKIFIVCGKLSFKVSGAENYIINILKKYNYIIFSDFTENPKIEDVLMGIKLFKQQKCDYVIAIGGGTAIDMAKLINIGSHNDNFEDMLFDCSIIKHKGAKLISIPTTCGSGSESTHFAVIYKNKIKYSVSHRIYMLPDIVILNPLFLKSLSNIQLSISAIDAFSQSIESYWSCKSTTISKKYSRLSILLILENLSIALHENNFISKKKLLLASYYSGKAINITKTTGAHALSYGLTSNYNIPHGQAVALTLIQWFKFNANVSDENVSDYRGKIYVSRIIKNISKLISGSNDINKTCEFLKIFFKKNGLEYRLSKFIVKKEELLNISTFVNLERLSNNPVFVNENDINKILYDSF
jgi:alcohol dehydrogenase class IV